MLTAPSLPSTSIMDFVLSPFPAGFQASRGRGFLAFCPSIHPQCPGHTGAHQAFAKSTNRVFLNWRMRGHHNQICALDGSPAFWKGCGPCLDPAGSGPGPHSPIPGAGYTSAVFVFFPVSFKPIKVGRISGRTASSLISFILKP